MRRTNAAYSTMPDRRWIATVRFIDGTTLTTTIYGRNCSEAEERFIREHTTVRSVVVHQECRS